MLHAVLAGVMAIERHITTLAVGDQEFSQPLFTGSADQRMSLKNFNPVANDVKRCNGSPWCVFRK